MGLAGTGIQSAGLSEAAVDTIIAATVVPAFSVEKTAAQDNIATSTFTKLTWAAAGVHYDTGSNFDDANDRFTATVAGKYHVTANIFYSGLTTGKFISTYIRINNADVTNNQNYFVTSAFHWSNISGDFVLAVDDYVEIFAFTDTVNAVDIAVQDRSRFMVHRIGP